MGLTSFAELQSEMRETKRKQAQAIIRQIQREQEANRRSYCIKTDRASMQRFVKTHYSK